MNIKKIALIIFLNISSAILSNMPEENNKNQSMTEEILSSVSNLGYNAGYAVYKFGARAWGFAEDYGRAQEAREHSKEQAKQIIQKDEALHELAKKVPDGKEFKKVTVAIEQVTATHKETNEILKDGLNKFEKVEQAVKVVGIVYTTASIVKDTYALYKLFYPTEDPEIKKAEDRRRLKILKTLEVQDALNECLVRNVDGAKDDKGMPIRCKDIGDLYSQEAGFAAFSQIRKDFNER